MIKKIAGVAVVVGVTLVVGCSSSNKPTVKVDAVIPDPVGAKLKWQTKLDGFVGDMDLSGDESRVLVSTVSDPQTGAGRFATIAFNSAGKVVWRADHGKRVRAQSIAADGSVASVTDYDHRLKLYGAEGQILFDVDAGCKPWVVGGGKSAKVYCFHDDDHEPGLSVEIFDASGKKLFSDKTKQDLLAYSVSAAGNFAMAFDGGNLKVIRADQKTAFEKKTEGEVLDLAVVDQAGSFGVAVLGWIPKKGQQISVFSDSGKLITKITPKLHLQQLDWDPESGALTGFANGTEGQSLVIYSADGKELWSRNVQRSADYLPKPVAAGGSVSAGVFDFNPGVGVGEIAGYSLSATTPGKILWSIPLVNEDQAYLFDRSHLKKPKLIAVSWDDGRLGAFELLE